MSQATTTPWDSLETPGQSGGFLGIFKNRYLLALLVRKEMRVRYRGSVLGLMWSYVKPATQFAVFYFALGYLLTMRGSLAPYALYLFSGIVVINLFSETLGNATRSLVHNAPLVKKIFIQRELFPVATYFVALVHFVPQAIILGVGALIMGWRPGFAQIAVAGAGFVIVSMFAVGLGLLFGALNVVYRDVENIVDLFLMVAVWLSPVLYSWIQVANAFGRESVALWLYQVNPLSAAVELFHVAFWYPLAVNDPTSEYVFPPDMWTHAGIAFAISAALLVVGQMVFSRMEGRFAQEL